MKYLGLLFIASLIYAHNPCVNERFKKTASNQEYFTIKELTDVFNLKADCNLLTLKECIGEYYYEMDSFACFRFHGVRSDTSFECFAFCGKTNIPDRILIFPESKPRSHRRGISLSTIHLHTENDSFKLCIFRYPPFDIDKFEDTVKMKYRWPWGVSITRIDTILVYPR